MTSMQRHRPVLFAACLLAATGCGGSEPSYFERGSDPVPATVADYVESEIVDSVSIVDVNGEAGWLVEVADSETCLLTANLLSSSSGLIIEASSDELFVTESCGQSVLMAESGITSAVVLATTAHVWVVLPSRYIDEIWEVRAFTDFDGSFEEIGRGSEGILFRAPIDDRLTGDSVFEIEIESEGEEPWKGSVWLGID